MRVFDLLVWHHIWCALRVSSSFRWIIHMSWHSTSVLWRVNLKVLWCIQTLSLHFSEPMLLTLQLQYNMNPSRKLTWTWNLCLWERYFLEMCFCSGKYWKCFTGEVWMRSISAQRKTTVKSVCKMHQVTKLKCLSSCLADVFVQSIVVRC